MDSQINFWRGKRTYFMKVIAVSHQHDLLGRRLIGSSDKSSVVFVEQIERWMSIRYQKFSHSRCCQQRTYRGNVDKHIKI